MPRPGLIETILAPGGTTVAFQPIYEFARGQARLFALEALTRGPAGSNLERADVLFDFVRRKGREADVDRTCVRNALKEFATIRGSAAVSLNVHSATIEGDPGFVRFLMDACAELSVPLSSVILEIVEHQQYCDERRFHRNIGTLRNAGVRVALDDVGVGYSNCKMMVEIRPDLFKVDRYFVHRSHANDGARAAMRSIVRLARDLGGRVIAEGVELEEDLQAVLETGVDMVQGFLLSNRLDAAAVRAEEPRPYRIPRDRSHALNEEMR